MRLTFLTLMLGTALLAYSAPQTFAQTQALTGTITDTMCGASHTMMNIEPDAKCVRECVKMDPEKWKYALLVGDDLYVLSDQQTPEQFAAQEVTVTGTVSEETHTIEVEKIEPAS